MIMASACLCGINCKYSGSHNADPFFVDLLSRQMALPFCPEQLGGLPTPRAACEIMGGDGAAVLTGGAQVVSRDGCDRSAEFIRGAREALKIARIAGIEIAVMKSLSPSCGVGRIYDGSFSHSVVPGDGVTTALFRENGIAVYHENHPCARLL